jgi:hypothetical protein
MKIFAKGVLGIVALVMLGCGSTSARPDGGGGASGTAGSAAAGASGGGTTGAAGTVGSGGGGAIGSGGGGAIGSGGGGAIGSGGGGAVGSGGGGGGSASCLNLLPCGGNLVGTWRFTADCFDLAFLQPLAQQGFCAQASVTAATVTRSGTATFALNGTYTVSQTATAIVEYRVPFSCVSASAASCVAFGDLIQQYYALPGETFTCSGSTICSCTDGVLSSGTDNGSYQTSGTGLTLTSAIDGYPSMTRYCVQGSTLHLLTIDATATTGIGEDIVLERQ